MGQLAVKDRWSYHRSWNMQCSLGVQKDVVSGSLTAALGGEDGVGI